MVVSYQQQPKEAAPVNRHLAQHVEYYPAGVGDDDESPVRARAGVSSRRAHLNIVTCCCG